MRVYTQGSFDIFHGGHINFLERCSRLAGEDGELIVSVLSDSAYEQYRGYPPTMPYKTRARIIELLSFVDKVVEGDPPTTKKQIKEVSPDIVAIGSDWASKDIHKQYAMTPEELDDILVYIPYTKTVSSTQIKKGLKNETD